MNCIQSLDNCHFEIVLLAHRHFLKYKCLKFLQGESNTHTSSETCLINYVSDINIVLPIERRDCHL